MSIAMSEDDVLFCQWLHSSIPDNALTILTLFNSDSFGQDSYLELRYRPEDSIANLYFCGNGIDKVRQDNFFHSVTQSHTVPHYSSKQELLHQSNPFCYLNSARICGEQLSYIFEILYECHGTHLNQPNSCRDGNYVTLKIFWPFAADFSYWVSPKNTSVRIKELVWLLADYLPRPARISLQSCLSSKEACLLQEKLQPTRTVDDDSLSNLQAIIGKRNSHAED